MCTIAYLENHQAGEKLGAELGRKVKDIEVVMSAWFAQPHLPKSALKPLGYVAATT